MTSKNQAAGVFMRKLNLNQSSTPAQPVEAILVFWSKC